MTESYLDMLSRSLDRKLEILKQIEQENRKQTDLLDFPVQGAECSGKGEEAWDQTVEAKGRMIEELTRLNDGFDLLFSKVQVELTLQKEKYRTQLARLQDQIREVTEMSNRIQVQEQRNKALVDQYFSEERTRIKVGKRSTATAMKYYQTMNRTQFVPSQAVDENR